VAVEVEIRDVWVTLSGTPVLRGVSLSASGGRATVVVGPSGSGKTTLLRVAAGFLQPDRGDVLIDGRSATHLSPQERGAALLSQRPVLLPHMSVADNIALAARLARGLTRGEARRLAAELAASLGLPGGVLGRKPAELSGGQLQRASLAAVLAARPRILLLDEPFAHLDLPLREELRRLVARLSREWGFALVQVTHDQDEALELADSLAVLVDGRIADYGPPERVYWRPSTLEAARFLGHNIHCGPPLAPRGELASAPPEAVSVDPRGQGWIVASIYRQRGRVLVRLRGPGGEGDLQAYVHPSMARRIEPGASVGVSVEDWAVRVWGPCRAGWAPRASRQP